MDFFDAHAHVQLPEFDADRDAVIARMRETNTGAIMIGVDLATSQSAIALAEKHDFLWAAVGLHPNDNPSEVFDDAAFAQLAAHPRVVAIGECGLDYFRSGGSDEEHAVQKERFQKQIALAAAVRKPLIVHCRNAHEDMFAILSGAKARYGEALVPIIHFCTVSGEMARKYLDIGCYLSFPGPITYTDMYDDSVKVALPERILAETDSPFAAPVPFRGRRNEPAYVAHVVRKIAEIREEDFEVVRAQILENARRVFGLT